MGTNKFCLAHITATESRKVSVKYVATHTNHQLNRKNLPIPRSIADEVKRMFANGVQVEKIMDGWCTLIP